MCLYNSKDGVQGRAGQTLKKSKNTFKKLSLIHVGTILGS